MHYFYVSIFVGVFLATIYQVIEIIRYILKASKLQKDIQDILFWTAAGIVVFTTAVRENDGELRWYPYVANMAGALCCRKFYKLVERFFTSIWQKAKMKMELKSKEAIGHVKKVKKE